MRVYTKTADRAKPLQHNALSQAYALSQAQTAVMPEHINLIATQTDSAWRISVSRRSVPSLQRTLGNRYLRRNLISRQQRKDTLRRDKTKLSLGRAGDRYKQEADSVVHAIMQQEQQPVRMDEDRSMLHRQEVLEEEEKKPIHTKRCNDWAQWRALHATTITKLTPSLRVQRVPVGSTPPTRNQVSHLALAGTAARYRSDPKVNAVVTSGQFYWGIKLTPRLESKYMAALSGLPDRYLNIDIIRDLKEHFDGLRDECINANRYTNTRRTRASIVSLLRQLVRTNVAPNDARIQLLKEHKRLLRVLGKRGRSQARGKKIFDSLWWTYFKRGINTIPERLIDFASMEALRKHEMVACGISAHHTRAFTSPRL